jgi:hypothetical protein
MLVVGLIRSNIRLYKKQPFKNFILNLAIGISSYCNIYVKRLNPV